MNQEYRICPDCEQDRPFEQYHPQSCPDAPDGQCPEWACTVCGAAFIVGFVPYAEVSGEIAEGRPVRAALRAS